MQDWEKFMALEKRIAELEAENQKLRKAAADLLENIRYELPEILANHFDNMPNAGEAGWDTQKLNCINEVNDYLNSFGDDE